MVKNFDELIKKVQAGASQTIAVAVAQDADVLSSVNMAYEKGIAKAILLGDKEEIEKIAPTVGMDLNNFEIIDIKDKAEACAAAVKLVSEGKADLPMKGFVDTSVILRAILNPDAKLTTGGTITHVGLLHVPGFERMFLLSDSAMLLAPTLEQKVDMINCAVGIAHAMGNENPKVAVLCAVEKVNPKMQCTLDADELTKMNESGQITGCMVKGPLAMDNAVSVEAAHHKGIDHPVAGNADIFITPDIEAGNILNKSMEYLAKAEKAGVIVGAKKPMILTSRASSDQSKMNSIALGVLVAQSVAK